MYSYSVFGGHLRSELLFPELRASESAQADWTFRVSNSIADCRGAELLGSALDTHCQIELYRVADHLRLYHSCTGWFEIGNGGRDITWSPAPNVSPESVRTDVFGRVLALAMHLQGVLSLHASAVAFEGGAVAFIAPKHHGKSTLAMALTAAGARLVTDDMLPIRANSSPIVRPGVQTIRLRNDSANRLFDYRMPTRVGVDGKHVVSRLEPEMLLTEETPLSAIYVLSPVKGLKDGSAVSRNRLSPVSATMSLITHVKVGALLGTSEAATVFDRAVALGRVVPVYNLEVVRDLERLAEVIETIYDWHQLPAAVA